MKGYKVWKPELVWRTIGVHNGNAPNSCGVLPLIKLSDSLFEFRVNNTFDEVCILSIQEAEKFI